MNTDIQNFIDSYENMMKGYVDRVPPENINLQKLITLLNELKKLGEQSEAIWTFMEQVQSKGLPDKFSALLTDLAMDALAEDKKKGGSLPTVAQAAAGYHAAFDAIAEKEKHPQTVAVYNRIFAIEKESESAPEFLARLAEKNLFLKMSTVALKEEFDSQSGAAEDLSLPAMAAHHIRMKHLSETAQTVHEIELESERLLHVNRWEQSLDSALANDLFYTLGNRLSSYLLAATKENRDGVVSAVRFVISFFGITPQQLFALPRIIHIIDHVILPSLNSSGKQTSRAAFIAEQLAAIEKCVQGQSLPSADSRKVNIIFQGKEVSLSTWQDLWEQG